MFFLAGGEGSLGVGDGVETVGIDGIVPNCAALPTMPDKRKGAAGTVDQQGNVLICGGVISRLALVEMSLDPT